VLTERVIGSFRERTAKSLRTATEMEITSRYPRPAALQARTNEAALIAVHSLATLLFIVTLALAGSISGTLRIEDSGLLTRAAAAGLTFCVSGTFLHLLRFYDAQIAIWRSRPEVNWSWPRSSSDLDFLVQLLAAVAIAALI